jgi:ribosomal subunit interface protein
MIIQVNAGDVQSSDALIDFTEKELQKALKHVADHVTRVEVHLHDDTAGRSHNDKRVTMEGRLRGVQPLAIEETGEDLYNTVRAAAQKLERALKHKIERVHPSGDERR